MAHVHTAERGLAWSQCTCGTKYLELAHRDMWMRLFMERRLFFCRVCRQRMLIPVPAVRRPN